MPSDIIPDAAVVNERYRLLKLLGKGAQGTVFSASDTLGGNRTVALKILTNTRFVSRFRFEFAQAKRLVHPHLVKIFDLGVVAQIEGIETIPLGSPFYTQELVEGVSVDQWAASFPETKRSLPIAKVGVAVARALALLHAKGLLHRDIKPSNILVSADGSTIKLIDLGLSAVKNTQDGLKSGTLGYMAPETLRGFSDERSDLYSLGVTLMELLTGQKPRTPVAVIPRAPLHVPAPLWTLAGRLITPEPKDRIQTARETVLALANAMGPELLGKNRKDELIDASTDPEDRGTHAESIRSSDFVGQVEERRRICQWIQDSYSKENSNPCSYFVLFGPPGVGKSRLFHTALVDAQLETAKRNLIPPALIEGQLRPIVRSISQRHLGPSPDDSPLSRWLRPELQPEIETHALETNSHLLVDAIVELIQAIRYPTVIMIEDGDNDLSVRLLTRLAKQQDTDTKTPMVVIGAEIRNRATLHRFRQLDAETVVVDPMSPNEERQLIENILTSSPGRAFEQKLHNLTAGIPLITESILTALIALNQERPLKDTDLDALSTDQTPEKLVLQGFCENLDEKSLSIAEILSVFNGPVSADEIARVAITDDTQQIFEILIDLKKQGWLTEHNDRFALKTIVAAGLQRTLENDRAKTLHKKVIAVLMDNPSTEPERLSWHAMQAGMQDLASKKARQAATALITAGDLTGAKEQLTNLLEIGLSSDTVRDSAQIQLARLCRQTGDYERAIRLAEKVESRRNSPAPQATLERAASLRLKGNTKEAIQLLDPLTKASDERVALEALALAARIDFDAGKIESASARIRKVTITPTLELLRSGFLSTAGLVALATGDAKQAREIFQTGLKAANQGSDIRNQARFNGLIGMIHHRDAQWEPALESYRTALALADMSGDLHGAATYAVNQAAALTELYRISEALDAYRNGLNRLRTIGRTHELTQAGANYAMLLLRIGDVERASKAIENAVSDTEKTGDRRGLALVLCVKGEVLLSQGKRNKAQKTLERSENIASETAMNQVAISCRHHLVELSLINGDYQNAEKRLSQIRDRGIDDQKQLIVEQLRLELELALATQSDPLPALMQLGDILPTHHKEGMTYSAKAYAAVARGAMHIGKREQALVAATTAINIIEQINENTPSLHRPGKSQMHEEMIMIRDTMGYEAPPLSKETLGWQHLARINTRLNSEMRIGRLLEMVMDAAIDISGAERGFLLIANAKQELKVSCARNIDKEALSPTEENYSRTVAQRAFENKEPILTTDATEDARFNEMKSVINLNLRYIAAIPLQVGGHSTGTIYLDSRHGGHFDDARITLLEALADQAAIALTNARLKKENRQRQLRIERLNRELESRLENREKDLERIKGELAKRTEDLITKYRYDEIVAKSKPMADLFKLLDKVVPNNFPVIISGESGTGKELVARAIHFNGPRKRKAFVAENCAAIPETLFESVLFGHVRGAFTGAVTDSDGLFWEASGGTLFLDEISEMPLATQSKLLRVLQEGEIRPVGGAKTKTVDVRVLIASNVDLAKQVAAGKFREDLFYRLKVISINLPPLRDRREDILLLAEHFLQKHAGPGQRRLSKEVTEILLDYSWPGNVRQLENEMIRAQVLSDNVIETTHLSEEIFSSFQDNWDSNHDLEMAPQVDRLKRHLINSALKKTKGNQSASAQLLGLSRYGLQKMMSRLRLNR